MERTRPDGVIAVAAIPSTKNIPTPISNIARVAVDITDSRTRTQDSKSATFSARILAT